MSLRLAPDRCLCALAALTAGVTAATTSAAQTLGQAPADGVSWIRVIAALLLCIGLALGAALALRYRLRGGAPLPLSRLPSLFNLRPLLQPSERRVLVLETVRVNPQLDVCLIRCDGADYLLVAGPQGPVLLNRQDVTPAPAAPEPGT